MWACCTPPHPHIKVWDPPGCVDLRFTGIASQSWLQSLPPTLLHSLLSSHPQLLDILEVSPLRASRQSPSYLQAPTPNLRL